MSTKAIKYFRFRCIECEEQKEFETIELAREARTEHNFLMHDGMRKAKVGRFFSMDPSKKVYFFE